MAPCKGRALQSPESHQIAVARGPLAGVRIVLYSGLATRWKGQETTTDHDGRFRFDPLQTGATIEDRTSGRWDLRPGMRIEHPTHVNLGQWYQPFALRTSIDGAMVAPVTVFWNMTKK